VRADRWKYLSLDGDEFLFDLAHDGRERANLALREPDRLDALRARYAAFASTMPPIHEAAGVHRVYGPSDIATPGS